MTRPLTASARDAANENLVSSWLAGVIDHVAHLLPEQAPLHAFVHHNTLHAFEHLPFKDAVVEASRLLGTEPYQGEEQFAQHVASGRILERDIREVLRCDGASDNPVFAGGPSEFEFRRLRLLHWIKVPAVDQIPWYLEEAGGLTRFSELVSDDARQRFVEPRAGGGGNEEIGLLLGALWKRLVTHAPVRIEQPKSKRLRDRLFQQLNIDTDEWTHPVLIRFTASYLDQGVSYWPMPHRDQGMLSAFRRIYGRRGTPLPPCFRGLTAALREQDEENWSPDATVEWALGQMGVSIADRSSVIQETLLSLRGWAGMVRQTEMRPDRAPVEPVPARLKDYLAIQLLLDAFSADYLVHTNRSTPPPVGVEPEEPAKKNDIRLAYEAFVCAQLFGLNHYDLTPTVAKKWLDVIADFDEIERRRLLHLAYERRHRVGVLDGLAAHMQLPPAPTKEPAFQALFCIDDREESLRRQLEEIDPCCETFGYAGFYGVAMNYQGLDDIRSRPLCPVSTRPEHLVIEVAADDQRASLERYRRARKRRGKVAHALDVSSRSMARGGVLAAIAGLVSTVTLIGHSLFPRLTNRLARHWQHRSSPPPTRLRIERSDLEPRCDGLWLGYTRTEMADIVASALKTMGLVSFSPLVIVVGHGSSSLNNPHEAAHDCGATGGGRGGPNARAFAAMANHSAVRTMVAERGVQLPDDTWFVGAYHNTCDDSMTYYDEDLVPEWAVEPLELAKGALHRACVLDAHERCRRFEDTPLSIAPQNALRAAETHALDLGQPRPEYGHATNAVCVVGRRSRTKGLFLDRRAFLVSYDPSTDSDGAILGSLLASVGPVGAGINLEYYFSFVDPVGYGSGTKLPHNIVGLFGVMDGHASDLRTGLPWQMVEIHEPVRLLNIVEAKPSLLEALLVDNPSLATLVVNEWIQLVAWDPDSDAMWVYEAGGFRPYHPECLDGIVAANSVEYYSRSREHLPPASLADTSETKRAL